MTDVTESLADVLIRRLKYRPASLTLTQLAKLVDMSPQWLMNLAAGRVEDPGVRTVEKLIKYLDDYMQEISQCSHMGNRR